MNKISKVRQNGKNNLIYAEMVKVLLQLPSKVSHERRKGKN
jgi:hypothetical protein